jgi:hypothetical protein
MQRLHNRNEWLLIRKPDVHIERTQDPVFLNLGQAIEWIKKEKPIIWLGSIFSVPEPSGLPSGFALTKSLLELVFDSGLSSDQRNQLTDTVLTQWPLESLFDEFEFLDFDLSESLLDFFKGVNDAVASNKLHHAITLYYQKGFARIPLCITTNWDTLQEKAFRKAGYSVIIGGPGEMPRAGFGKQVGDQKTIFLYHPHGSFETQDVVCSFKREQRQLALNTEFMYHPTLFLGYSGYEPSLYRRLEFIAGQLWCIRDRSDLENPSKRRLLCRPNTFVYVGDLRELLRALNIFEGDVDLQSKYVAPGNNIIPRKIREIVQLSIISSLNPNICIDAFANTLMSFLEEPEATIRYIYLMRAIVNHIRNRIYHPGLLLSLIAASRFRDSEQIWISTLAYLLRVSDKLDSKTISQLIKQADEVKKRTGKSGSIEDNAVYMPGVLLNRTKIYKSYTRMGEKIDDEKLYTYPPLVGSDMAAEGENIEILAFEYLREGKKELARNYFDYAATSFFLRGLLNAGQLNEWASNNIESISDIAKKSTLLIPHAKAI